MAIVNCQESTTEKNKDYLFTPDPATAASNRGIDNIICARAKDDEILMTVYSS